MDEYLYQRQIIAYHGCDRSIADKVLLEGEPLKPSKKSYDWLGSGIYFWEHGPLRALAWARERSDQGSIAEPSVIGAVINLGNCFDLMDIRFTETLRQAWPLFLEAKKARDEKIPTNQNSRKNQDQNRILRFRDCAVINWMMDRIESDGPPYDSVRGVFQEDEPVYEDSEIRLKSHIQIAIRNPACIIGYFRPSFS